MSLQQVLETFTYKDGFSFRVVDESDLFESSRFYTGASRLLITVTTRDTYSPDGSPAQARIGHQYPIPPHLDLEAARHFLRHCIHTTEMHEADEWMRFDGEMLFNPHKEMVR